MPNAFSKTNQNDVLQLELNHMRFSTKANIHLSGAPRLEGNSCALLHQGESCHEGTLSPH